MNHREIYLNDEMLDSEFETPLIEEESELDYLCHIFLDKPDRNGRQKIWKGERIRGR